MNVVNIISTWLFLIVVFLGFIHTQVPVCSQFCAVPQGGGVTCDAVVGQCLEGCIDGYAGSQCTIQCCGGCKTCTDTNAGITCDACQDGFYLASGQCFPCSKTCAVNASSTLPKCRPSDGFCEFGCQESLYGDLCDQMCSKTCKDGNCDQTDGSCTSGCILPVLTGPMCQEACSEGCKRRECDQSGTCATSGCQQGYWGTDCSNKCSKNCVEPGNIVDAVCDPNNATCLLGCVNNTHWGANCSYQCSATCFNKKCEFANGDCMGGCVENYEGRQCLEELKSTKTRNIIIGAAIGGGVFLIILIVIICCICKKCRS